MKVEYDRSACSAWFQCIQKWNAFQMNPSAGKADLKHAEEIDDDLFVREVPETAEGDALAAAGACPVHAIRIFDDEGQQLVPEH